MRNTYGVINQDGVHIDVSDSLKGAKNYATRHGYTKVSVRYDMGYNAYIVAEKINGKWVNID